jgi:omega-amidase
MKTAPHPGPGPPALPGLPPLNLFALQLDIAWEDKASNFARVKRLLGEAKPAPGSLVALPEMFATGFTMNVEAMAESYGEETEQFLAQAAEELGIWILGGAAMCGQDGRARNKALVFSPAGKLEAFYAKMRPFTPGGEGDHYVAGVRPVKFRWGGTAVCPFICYDLRFPELFREAAAAHRPELFVVIANWPEQRIGHWITLLTARAIENQAYVVGVNRVGHDPYNKYTGRSLIIAPSGDLIADAGEKEGWIEARLDLDALVKYRQGLPFLEDLKRVTGDE